MLNSETSRRTAGREFAGETFKLMREIKASYSDGDYDKNRAHALGTELKGDGWKVRIVKDSYDNYLVYARPKNSPKCPVCGGETEINAYVNGIWRSHFYYICAEKHVTEWEK